MKKEQKKWYQLKLKYKYLIRLIVITAILASVVSVFNLVNRNNEVTNAKPNDGSAIVIDETIDSEKLTLPFDSLGLKEDFFINQTPTYDLFNQNDIFVDSLVRNHINGYYDVRSLQGLGNVKQSIQLDNGNFLVLGSKQDAASQNEYSGFFAAYVDPLGVVIGNPLDTYTTGMSTGNYNQFDGIIGRVAGKTNAIHVVGGMNSKRGVLEVSVDASNKINVKFVSQFPAGSGNASTTKVEINEKSYIQTMIDVVGNASNDTGSSKMQSYLVDSNGNITSYVQQERLKVSQVMPDVKDGNYLYVPDDAYKTNNYFASTALFWRIDPYNLSRSTLTITDNSGKLTDFYLAENTEDRIYFYETLCSNDTLYWQEVNTATNTIIIKKAKLSSSGKLESITTLERLPANSSFYIVQEDGKQYYLAYVTEKAGLFDGFDIPVNSIVTGYVDNNFNVQSAVYEETTGSVAFKNAIPFMYKGDLHIFYSGDTYSNEILETIYPGGSMPTPPDYKKKVFWGSSIVRSDYAPIIYEGKNLAAKQADLQGMNEDELDNYLIYGNTAGTRTTGSVKVDDRFDILVYTQLGNSEADRLNRLYSRINRNINNLTNSIDWTALGLNKNKNGPQNITYFVSDSQRQISSTSKILNVYDDETVIKDDYYLDVHNFAVPLVSVSTDIPDVNTFKEYAKSLAWNGETGKIDEDALESLYDDTKVTVNMTQLQAVQNATVARPYPVDVTYTPESGIEIVNRVWVFVTTKNTVVDILNSIVFYGDDYTIPWHVARTQTKNDVYNMGNIKIYDYYDSTHETDDKCIIDPVTKDVYLPPLADKDNTTGIELPNLNIITNANIGTTKTVQPIFEYTDDRSVSNTEEEKTIDVTIYSSVLLHVRQVVVSNEEDLVTPVEGFVTLRNTGDVAGIVPDDFGVIVPSGLEADNPSFRDAFSVILDTSAEKNQLQAHLTVPEYYQYLGFVVTDSEPTLATPHKSENLNQGVYTYSWDYTSFEKWLTLYIKPTSEELPAMYSWDYKLNDFGQIIK